MSRKTTLIGGDWHGRAIEVPDFEPRQILMPLVDTELQLLTYERQADGSYEFRGQDD